MDFLKNKKIALAFFTLVIFIVSGFASYRYLYIPYEQHQEGWVYAKNWDCPTDHPIKGNLHSNIYHTYASPYYDRTNARNCKCFDTAGHAQVQGFRAPLNR